MKVKGLVSYRYIATGVEYTPGSFINDSTVKGKILRMSLMKMRIVYNQIFTSVFTALNQPDISHTNE